MAESFRHAVEGDVRGASGGRLPLHFPSGCEDATWHEVAARNLLAGRAESPIVGEDSILCGVSLDAKGIGPNFLPAQVQKSEAGGSASEVWDDR